LEANFYRKLVQPFRISDTPSTDSQNTKRKDPFAETDLTRNIPVIEMPGGKILTQSYVILRHWGKQLCQEKGMEAKTTLLVSTVWMP
jgi:hypothetical protein